MQVKLYWAMTHFEKVSNKPWLIHWYCPERLKPLADCQKLISDYDLCPEEPIILSGFEYKAYYDLFTKEERKRLLTPLDPDDPDYIEGVDLSKEEIEVWYNYRHSKDELTRAINELFTEKEIELLKQYLQEKYGFSLDAIEVDFPMSNFCLKGYCREAWNNDKEPDYILHEDPDFPLSIPVEGGLEEVHMINVNITMKESGQLRFRFENEP